MTFLSRAFFVSILACITVTATAYEKLAIKEIYSSPPCEKNADLGLLKDGVFSKELKKNIQWNIDAKTSLSSIQLDFVLDSSSIVKKIELSAMQRLSWNVYFPASLTVKVSEDGRQWEDLGKVAWSSKEDRTEHLYVFDVPEKFNSRVNFVRLMIAASAKAQNFSAVCVDEVSIYGLKSETGASAPSGKLVRNHIANGSFESNSIPEIPDFWTAMSYWPYYDYVNMVSIFSDSNEAYSGKYSLCFDSSAFKENFRANDIKLGQSFLLGGNSNYTVSFYSKAKMPGASLKVISGKSSKIFKLSDEWKRYEFVTSYTDDKKQFLFFQLVPVEDLEWGSGVYRGGQKIWLDDVQIEEGRAAGLYTANYLDMGSVKQAEAAVCAPSLKVTELKDSAKKDPDIGQLIYLGSSSIVKGEISANIFRDKDNLYITANFPLSGTSNTKEHDGPVYTDDSVEIFLMPDSNKKEYFHIAVNSIGTVFDARYQFGDKAVSDIGWTAPFKYSVDSNGKNWTLTMTIPKAWLGQYLGDGDFRFNLCRKNASWAPMRSGFHEPENFGILEGVEVFRQKHLLQLGDASVSYDLNGKNYILEIPFLNEADKSLPVNVNYQLAPAESGKDKIAMQEKMLLAPGAGKLTLTVPGTFHDLNYFDLSAWDQSGNSVGQCRRDIIFKAPAALLLNKFIVRGEPIAIKPILTFKDQSSFSGTLKLLDMNGKLLLSHDIPALSEDTVILPSDALNDGWYSLELSIFGRNGQLLASSSARTYISGPVSSWSRIDSETKTLVVNGKSIFPFGIYYQPVDGLARLKDNFYNICYYRPKLPFDEKRCLNFLDDAEKNGIAVFIDLTTIMRMEKNEERFFELLKGFVNLVKTHPAYAGIHQCDEPNNKPEGLKTQENLRKTYKFLELLDPAHISFFVVGGVLTYRYAFDAEDVIFYDRYATVTGPETRNLRENTSALYAALSTASYYNKPTWRALEGNEGAFPNWVRNPNAAEWRVLVFSTLAAGGNGIFLWSGEPSFLKLRDAWSLTNKKFSEVVPYFLNGKKSSSIKLNAPENLLWRAVDYEGQTILLVVNLDYEKVSCRFNVPGGISSIKNIMDDKIVQQGGNNSFSYELAPYDVGIFSIK